MSIPSSSFGFLARVSFLFAGLSPENRSTALARDADVEALETGMRGLELRNGGDFFGIGAEIYAFRRGLFALCRELVT